MDIIKGLNIDIVSIYLNTPNVKLKNQLANLMLNEKVLIGQPVEVLISILQINKKLVTKEWENKNLPDYQLISALDSLKEKQLLIVPRVFHKLFSNFQQFQDIEL